MDIIGLTWISKAVMLSITAMERNAPARNARRLGHAAEDEHERAWFACGDGKGGGDPRHLPNYAAGRGFCVPYPCSPTGFCLKNCRLPTIYMSVHDWCGGSL